MTSDANTGRDARPIGILTKLAYGFGAAAYGVKDNGFNYFLLIFYSQVIGVDARLVGMAIFIALIFDALSDPVVGYWSDNLRSRWGRRHPFMYAAAIPVALSYALFWMPPTSWSDTALFWYILLLAILIRTFITVFETPSTALTPELSANYDERSSIVSFRFLFAWVGGNFMTVLMFFVLFPLFITDTIADGRFNPESYIVYGYVSAALIFLSIIVCAFGTHHRIPHLKQAPPSRNLTLRKAFGEIAETLAEKSFIALFGAALFGSIATGLAAALSFYFYTYFWEFTSIQTGIIILGIFISAGIGFLLAPFATKKFGKKRAAMSIGIVAFIGAPLPIFLRLIGVLPDNGTPALFWFVFVTQVLDVGLIICFQILIQSMIADLVEQSELKTGRRNEGVFFAAATFIKKMVQGLGVMMASLVLYLAQFPAGADVTEVPAGSIFALGAWYVPSILTIWFLMMVCVSFYRLDRSRHEENLRKLEQQRDTA